MYFIACFKSNYKYFANFNSNNLILKNSCYASRKNPLFFHE